MRKHDAAMNEQGVKWYSFCNLPSDYAVIPHAGP
jgi:hypothetical protein